MPGVGPAKVEKPAAKAAETTPVPAVKDNSDPVEALQFEIDRAKLQVQRAELAIKTDQQMQTLRGSVPQSELNAYSITGLQAKEDKLVAERNLKLAERKLAALKSQPVAAAAPMTPQLRKLREQRMELARNNWKAFSNFDLQRKGPDYVIVRVLLATALTASQAVLESELDLAATPAQRADAWKAQRERLQEIRQALDSKLFLGGGSGLLGAEMVAQIKLVELGVK